ncbi:MAG: RHS repeat-associated core domain-containing protein, partial [Bacteroidota bacterium]
MTTSDTQILFSVVPEKASPVGAVVVSEGTFAEINPWKFSTKYFDLETLLGYWGMRWYSTEINRWMSRDPLGERGGRALYMFVVNCPVVRIDPFGLWTAELYSGPTGIGDGLVGFRIEIGYEHETTPSGATQVWMLNKISWEDKYEINGQCKKTDGVKYIRDIVEAGTPNSIIDVSSIAGSAGTCFYKRS